MAKVIWNPGNIMFPLANATFRIYQPHYRTNWLLSYDAIELIDKLVSAGETGIDQDIFLTLWDENSWRIKDATVFSLYDHAYANSSMYDDQASLSEGDRLSGEDALESFLYAGILADSWPITYSHEKKGFVDQSRGSFYEQIGTACLLNRRQPTEWWTDQKFTDDRLSTRETAYNYIQDKFLDGFLEAHVTGKSIIEVGCGTGYYTNRMAQVAEKAVGVDYNSNYIEIAKHTWQNQGERNAHYGKLDVIDFSTDEPELIASPYDYVILIDTFLFLFHETYQPELYQNRHAVLRNLKKLIKKDGRILIMDPHPLFLTPYFGDPNRPFGILESYNTHYFRVAPTLPEITQLLCEVDLGITKIIEPTPHPEFANVNAQGNSFYKEVPMWHLLEIAPV